MRPYLLMNEVTPVEVGSQHEMLPLHSTLVHWFWLDDAITAHDVGETIADVYTRNIRLIPQREETFTAQTNDGEIPVRVSILKRTPELIDLHERALASLVSLDAEHEKPEYIHEGFHPHITHQKGETVNPSGYISRNLYVVTADRPEYGNMRTVVAKIALSRA
jgi:hypothetical protein